MAKKTETRPSTGHINPFGLRMQHHLREKLEKAASESGRSLNAEIVARLEASLSGSAPGEFDDFLSGIREQVELVHREASLRRIGESARAGLIALIPKGKIAPEQAEILKKTAKESGDDPLAQLLARILDGELALPQEHVDALFASAITGMSHAIADHFREENHRKKAEKAGLKSLIESEVEEALGESARDIVTSYSRSKQKD